MLIAGIEAVVCQLVYIPLQKGFQSVYSSLSIGAHGTQGNRGAGDDAQGHDAQQTLGVHFPILGFQPDAAFKFIGLLHEICSLLVVKARLTTDYYFLIEHFHTLLFTTPDWVRRVWVYDSHFQLNCQLVFSRFSQLTKLQCVKIGYIYAKI